MLSSVNGLIMLAQTKSGIDIHRLPVNAEEHTFNSWQVSYKQSHILHSMCSKDASNPCGDNDEACLFCMYNHRLELPHMPDMVFPNNKLVLKHTTGCVIEFNALDALKRVSNGRLNMKVACADAWKESRQEAEKLDEVKPFDWTFTTDYKGTLSGNFVVTATEEKINMDKLKQREKILFYHDLTLFEDELHDNGTAVCSVKIRVMPSSYFILLRYFLRVDNLMVRLNDTRYYHEFDTDYVLREYTSKEAAVKDLKVPAVMLIEPSEVAQFLPLVKTELEKLTLPVKVDETGEGCAGV